MQFSIPGLKGAVFAALFGASLAPALATPSPESAPSDAMAFARQVLVSADHGGLPFAVVDKRGAMLMVFRGNGQLVGTTPVLLGRTAGDKVAPGVGERAQTGQLRMGDQVTAAGRFGSEPGHNLAGEDVVWIDYESALAIHRLRPGASQRERALRLASADPRSRRMSAGCVVVPVAFYEAVVAPVLGRGRGVVYVTAEDTPPPRKLPAAPGS